MKVRVIQLTCLTAFFRGLKYDNLVFSIIAFKNTERMLQVKCQMNPPAAAFSVTLHNKNDRKRHSEKNR